MEKMKFGLLGQGISHSLSPWIFKKKFELNIEYELFDLKTAPEDILSFLQDNDLKGLNITAPYKKKYMLDVEREESWQTSINTLRREDGKVFAMSSDYMAAEMVLGQCGHRKIVLLGDGNMGNMFSQLLRRSNTEFTQFSRRQSGDLNKINYEKIGDIFLINTCSREFVFSSTLSDKSYFYDLNYDYLFSPKKQKYTYQDGKEFLLDQAKFTKNFWKL